MGQMQNLRITEDQKKEIIRQYNLLTNDVLNEREFKIDKNRNDFQRDYARILYSPSFRRLQGKMQIFGIQSDAFYRNRLTHSLEVAQIAKSIALLLREACDNEIYTQNDLFVIEAAGLAHDIGHPAFGHKGERVLDELAMEEFGMRFEGNAHNFRVLRKLETKEIPETNKPFGGLNLTNRTLLAINKYLINEQEKNNNKFLYVEDFDYLEQIREKTNLKCQRTLDVQIIELADDIAYAVHDLEDGLSQKIFTIDEILSQLDEKNKKYFYEDFIDPIKKDLSKLEQDISIQKYSKLFRMGLTSRLTNSFINDIIIDKISKSSAEEHGTKENVQELTLNKYASLLKQIKSKVFTFATREDRIQLYEQRGEVVIRSLFDLYSNINTNPNGKFLPPDYRYEFESKVAEEKQEIELINKNDKLTQSEKEELKARKSAQYEKAKKKLLAQGAINYIAGMMDTFAIAEFEKLFGVRFDHINISKVYQF